MQARLNHREVYPEALKALMSMENAVRKSELGDVLIDLVYLRVSQLNGCAYCVDLHSHDLRKRGEREQRVYTVAVWQETTFFSQRERVALAFAEAVTQLGPDGVPDDIYAAACAEFGDRQLVELVLAIAAINAWNRFGVTFRNVPPTRSE
ncbi:MAG: carboxymuconolactone decarboxylase family protein [Myxococcales bacterium]